MPDRKETLRIAALYDIHGNLPALEAVLRDVRLAGANAIVVGGDVLPGPMPVECLAFLRDCGVPAQFIHGNGESAVLSHRQGINSDPPLSEQAREAVRWTAEQLDTDVERAIARWPLTLRMNIVGIGDVLFCHATPRNDNEIFTRLTPEERLVPIFDLCGADLVVCGHTHMQFDRMVGRTRVVNAGSVGMPFGEPGAHWLLLRPEIELRHTSYDLANAAERVRATSYPQADEFASRNVLQPPPADAMLQAMTRAELKE
jgi:predicted phosphodiesterase